MGTGGADEDEEGDELRDEGPSVGGEDGVSYDWGAECWGLGRRYVCIYLSYT